MIQCGTQWYRIMPDPENSTNDTLGCQKIPDDDDTKSYNDTRIDTPES